VADEAADFTSPQSDADAAAAAAADARVSLTAADGDIVQTDLSFPCTCRSLLTFSTSYS